MYGVLKPETTGNNGWIGGTEQTWDSTSSTWTYVEGTNEGTWSWTDGSSFSSFSNWATISGTLQPGGGANQNCIQMRHADGMWDDWKCSNTRVYYVCKK